MPFSDNFLDSSINGGSDPIISLMRVQFNNTNYYFVNNNESVQSSASGSIQTYERSRFSLSLPDDSEEGTPRATINFETADIRIVRELRDIDDYFIIDIWLVLGSNPDIVEFGPVNYQSAAFTINENSIQIELEVEPVLQIQIPRDRFTPNTFPGLFEGR